MTQDYYGTKRVTAWPQQSHHNGLDEVDGYGVKYENDYVSWSPKGAFESAYQPLNALSFGHALVALKEGKRVARAGWNGKGMWLQYVPKGGYGGLSIQGVTLLPWIGMKTVGAEFVPWLASQTDVLAEDWVVLE